MGIASGEPANHDQLFEKQRVNWFKTSGSKIGPALKSVRPRHLPLAIIHTVVISPLKTSKLIRKGALVNLAKRPTWPYGSASSAALRWCRARCYRAAACDWTHWVPVHSHACAAGGTPRPGVTSSKAQTGPLPPSAALTAYTILPGFPTDESWAQS